MRLVLVSNRLPVTADTRGNRLVFTPSVGGLATGISGFLANLKRQGHEPSEYLWVGWPGATVPEKQREDLKKELQPLNGHPVFLSKEQMENFYHGFCNRTIWPLFHYFPSFAVYKREFWKTYVEVNRIFCEGVAQIARPDDVIWIHDYHLLLLPGMLRSLLPRHSIGFFLHIPFPSFEIFRLLPKQWRIDILHGMLGADLTGFHTRNYVQYYLRCIHRVLGLEHKKGEVAMPERTAKTGAFPMGIDFARFMRAAKKSSSNRQKPELPGITGKRQILSVDRLDYSKGILNRLRGYERFLENNAEFHEKVTLILIVVPSRVGVDRYQQMKKEIDESVGRINGRFATLDWIPIVYQFRSFPFDPLSSLYASSDVILVTPLRDGMNLIAKEYVASRPDKTGVLILSEMAGAAEELQQALIINPNDTEEIASALRDALKMSQEEQIKRNRIMQERLRKYTAFSWADHFLNTLHRVTEKSNESKHFIRNMVSG